ncbi:MAG TPA: FGGY-family carbohydrate kinase, partial [Candidatus Limnocylindrales bacterium]
MTADQVLALDVGTQSVRAIVFDARGEVVAKARIPIEPYVSPQPGWAEQDADLYWRSIGEACAALWSGGVARRDAIAGLTLTTQRGTVVVTDEAGTPLRPAIVWLDQRRAEDVPEIGGATGLAFRALRVRRTVAAFQADCEANWLRANEPATWSRIRRHLLLSGYVTHRLTGRFVDSLAAQVGYLPFDFKQLAWAKPGDWRWQAAPVDPAWLPELVAPGDQLGELTAEAAALVGLPAGTPVFAAAADKACEVIGSGALEPHVGALSYGTAATINTTQRRYVEAIPLVPPYPAAIPRAYSLEVQVYRGYWLVDWFKRQFGAAEVAQADALGVAPEALFDDLVRATEPGSMGLVLQPTWTPGVRIPGPEAKGAMIGFGDVHTRAHVYRAILEGLAFALREGGERAARRAKTPLRELRVSGGGAQSPAAVHLTADVFGLP